MKKFQIKYVMVALLVALLMTSFATVLTPATYACHRGFAAARNCDSPTGVTGATHTHTEGPHSHYRAEASFPYSNYRVDTSFPYSNYRAYGQFPYSNYRVDASFPYSNYRAEK